MFRGHSHRSLDSKCRIMLPPEFREEIYQGDSEGRLMLTNFDQCVVGYPIPDWEKIEERFSRLNMANRKFRDFHRFFISGAMEAALDKQGRILVPPYLRDYAGLRREAVLAGVGRKSEIWDLERFEAQRSKMEMELDNVMDSLAESGVELMI
ncbi:MAG: division/cell wall cluster transcriptional repressor MraZ [Desulfonatronovibrionaceae bacterium]